MVLRDNAGNPIMVIDTGGNVSKVGSLSVAGHAGGAVPTSGSLQTHVTSVTPTGNDGVMHLSIVLDATGIAAGAKIATITFAQAYPNANYAIIATCTSGQAQTLIINNKAAGSFDINAGAAISNGTFTFDLIVIGQG